MYADRIQIGRMLFQDMWHSGINSRKYGRKAEENADIAEMLVNSGMEGISTKICTKRK